MIAAVEPDGSAPGDRRLAGCQPAEDTLYLVDYLLDLCWAPAQGPWPAERAVEVLKNVWAGWKLIVDLRELKGAEAVAYARKLPYSHVPTRERRSAKYSARG